MTTTTNNTPHTHTNKFNGLRLPLTPGEADAVVAAVASVS